MIGEIDGRVVRRVADMHAMYRMFDAEGRVLYIGISGVAGRRFDQHSGKAWFPLVVTITLEWHPTKAAAVLAETRAIAAERPRYNKAGKAGTREHAPQKDRLQDQKERLREILRRPAAAVLEYPADTLSMVSAVRGQLADGTARRWREAAGVSASEVGAMIGVSRQSVSAWESGRAAPATEHALAYGTVLASLHVQPAA